MARGISLAVDVLAPRLAPRTAALMTAVGSTLLFAFLAVLSIRMGMFAATTITDGRNTQMLEMPVAPFIVAAVALLGFAAVIQSVIAFRDWRLAFVRRYDPALRPASSAAFDTALAILGVAVLIVAGISVVDFGIVQNFAQTYTTFTVITSVVMVWVFLLCLIPLAAVLGLVGVYCCAMFIGFAPALSAFVGEALGFLSNYQVAALPLFLMMGSFAAVAGVAEDVYRLAQAVLGAFRGGLAMATIGGCAGFGAVTGSSLATVATFGKVSLPEMRARGYAPEFSVGCVAAGGTLGALIPPSGALIIYALMTETSIGQLFVAAVIPGLLATALYLITITLLVKLRPHIAPPAAQRAPGEMAMAIRKSWSVVILFGSVIGGMYTGVFTATEAAGVGAFGAFLIALFRGRLKLSTFWEVMADTTASTAMIYSLIFGVLGFSFFVEVSALPDQLIGLLGGLNLPPIGIILLLLVIYLFLGCVMDSFTVMIVTVPVVTPIILYYGYDLVWWGIINLVIIETGLITPPFGLHIFVIRSMVPDVSLGAIYRGVLPFCTSDFVKLCLIVLFPPIAMWLPSTMFN
jgi:tripartite ATP-independent transporter DctM subunit